MYETRQTTIPFPSHLNSYFCDEKKGSYGPQFLEAYSKASHINNSIPRKEKDIGSFTLPCFINIVCFDNAFVDLGASVSVMPLSTYLNLGLGELAHTKLAIELADMNVKYPKGISKNVLIVRPFLEDYIELNDVNEPFELRRNQGDDLMPTIEEGEVIEEFKTRNDELSIGIDDYSSYCDNEKKIHIDYAHNLKFSCMIGFKFTHANFFPLLYVNEMSKNFHNYIMKDKMVYNGNNVVGALMNVPVSAGTFSVMTNYAVLENMDVYRDEEMGDINFGEPFLREVGIKSLCSETLIKKKQTRRSLCSHKEIDLETAQNNAVVKFPLLNQGDYDMTKLRIEQYIQLEDYALWEDAKTLFEAIQSRFGGNDATKKNQKTLLKQMYENFKHQAQPSDSQQSSACPANQPNGSQLVHEDLEQIHEDDLEVMDLKWQLALLSMRARRYFQKTGKKITINGSDTAGYDKTKVECFNCHKLRHFARECRNPRSQESRPRNYDKGNRNLDSSRRTVNVEDTSSKSMVAIDGAGFDWSFMAEEEVPTNMALMALSDSEVYNMKTCSNTCLKSYETLKSRYDNLRIELNKSKFDLANYKRGLASVEEQLVFYKKNEGMLCDQIAVLKRDASFHDSKINALNIQIERLKKEKESNQIKIDNFENASKSLDKLIGSQISDNNIKGVGYNVVPPPPTGLFEPPTINLSNSGLEEFKQPEFEGYGVKVNKSVCENSSNEIKKTSDAPIIEDWVSDCDEDESVVKVLESVNSQQKPKQADEIRKGDPQVTLNDIGIFDSGCSLLINDGEQQITVIVDGHKFAITEASARRHLQLADPYGLSSLPNTEIFEQLTLMGYVSNDDILTFKKGGYIPRSDEGSKKLNELTELCTKLFDKVTSLEKDLKQTKEVHGKALTKLVKKVKHMEDKLKSTTERGKARMVILDDEEDLVSEDPSKQGRMTKKEYEDVETEYAEVEHEFDQTDILQDPISFEMREWKNGSHVGTLACMRLLGIKSFYKFILLKELSAAIED
ncbi:ribonuclease H-like domain-containing protein [Tanacetum coccineum]|uniref:Ribonuclease H-like domain-containing protein n=1 Tax=Tanacetum coccineum TaxID=301880 RepID=A0ABQ5EDG8_9ASTR